MIQDEILNPTEKRLNKVWWGANFTEFLVFALFAEVGYLSLLSKTPPIIINRPALPNS